MTSSAAWALDLDGVVWLADHPIEGSADAIARLRSAGHHVAFVTNFSYSERSVLADKLERHGIDPGDGLVTSSMAAARMVEPGSRAMVVGGPGIADELRRRDVDVVLVTDPSAESARVESVVVGLDPAFDYRTLTVASAAIRAGARLVATNADSTYPTPNGPVPGGGSLVAAIATAAGVDAEVAGKPHAPIADLVRELVGPDGIMVGDRPDTDGRFAATLGWPFGLVLSGVTTAADLPVDPAPDRIAPSLAAMVDEALSAPAGDR